MKKIILIAALVVSAAYCSFSQRPKEIEEILKVLETQQLAWNKGDINAFMQGYWNDDSLIFVGSTGPQYGWKNTLDRYLKSYDSPEKMGELQFDVVRLKPTGNNTYTLLGKWHLTRTVGDVGGYFTLIFQKMKDGWKIVYDHTS